MHKNMNHILLPCVMLLAPVAGLQAADSSKPAPSKPNILVIVADDLGYGDIGVHGGRDVPTPNIDALAAGGVRCTNGYVSAPYCSPSRAGFLTGRYQTRFGHEFNPHVGYVNKLGLPLEQRTIADRLRGAGYATTRRTTARPARRRSSTCPSPRTRVRRTCGRSS